MKTEKPKIQLIVDTLGEETIEELYIAAGDTQFSFSKLYNYIRKFKIIRSLRAQKAIDEIAEEHKVSKMTVYRVLWDNTAL